MSKYYTIASLKVRVSDHEPNFSMDKFRGKNDVELYTKSADNQILSVEAQIERYCEKNTVDIALFAQVLEDFPDAGYEPVTELEKIEVTQEVIDGYWAITGKGSSRKKEMYCKNLGLDAYAMSQGNYNVR